MKCPYCSGEVSGDEKRCPFCRSELSTGKQTINITNNYYSSKEPTDTSAKQEQLERCPRCNEALSYGFSSDGRGLMVYCQRCGYKKMGGTNKRKSTALVLCIFLGYCGIHYFYVGRIGKGLLYLCTFGLFAIGWIKDIFVIINNDFRDKNGIRLS